MNRHHFLCYRHVLVNGKIKQWRFFNQTIQNSSIPFVGDYLNIVCSLINCYRASAIKDIHSGAVMAQEMINLLHSKNICQERLRRLEASKELKWKKYDAQYCLFPSLTATYVQQITKGKSVTYSAYYDFAFLGSYQIFQAKQYIKEHLKPSILDENEFEFQVQLSAAHPELVRVCFQSRHSNAKTYQTTIQFDDQQDEPIEGWYCTCCIGSRTVGCCSHVTAILWHLGVARAVVDQSNSHVWTNRLHDAVDDSVQYSEIEESSDDDHSARYNLIDDSSDSCSNDSMSDE